ncbi:hypothetical protein EYF80_011700 [Liparis tanakae]|uniref:Uncharacterized protein n=1 Tax=Liparis tanakae TaxID=230148 RepID=A0A4Z2IK69_9TELE|nr:hypothetical protein EYF80_011700 [Liparis tanakae]
MVAVQMSPNSSPSAEWICCLDKRYDCVFSTALSFIRVNVNRSHLNRRSLRVQTVRVQWRHDGLRVQPAGGDRVSPVNKQPSDSAADGCRAERHHALSVQHLHGQKGVGGFEVHRDVAHCMG